MSKAPGVLARVEPEPIAEPARGLSGRALGAAPPGARGPRPRRNSAETPPRVFAMAVREGDDFRRSHNLRLAELELDVAHIASQYDGHLGSGGQNGPLTDPSV